MKRPAARNPVLEGTLVDRFWSKVRKTKKCWYWTGGLRGGYGRIKGNGRKAPTFTATRVSWAIHFGDLPEGMEIGHRCNNPACVRPDHLYPTTHSGNVLDAVHDGLITLKTHCKRGHKFTQENTRLYKGKRRCRECGRAEHRDWWKRRGQKQYRQNFLKFQRYHHRRYLRRKN